MAEEGHDSEEKKRAKANVKKDVEEKEMVGWLEWTIVYWERRI